MKYISLAFIFLSAPAAAYDDQHSAHIFVQCLVSHQRKMHYPDSISLAMSCQSEAQNFMRYNCPNDQMQCEELAFEAAGEVIEKECQRTPGCRLGR